MFPLVLSPQLTVSKFLLPVIFVTRAHPEYPTEGTDPSVRKNSGHSRRGRASEGWDSPPRTGILRQWACERGAWTSPSMPSGMSPMQPRAEAKAVIERWNEMLGSSRDMPRSPTIRATLIAGTPWCSVPAAAPAGPSICGRSTVTPWRQLRRLCSAYGAHGIPKSAPMPKIFGLHALPPAASGSATANLTMCGQTGSSASASDGPGGWEAVPGFHASPGGIGSR